ncbi:hypothetical protein J6590_056238 [Homalodisca vitripennis]|nr:hypothetical protein J6590_056238 [Homalodisca vitripennis]
MSDGKGSPVSGFLLEFLGDRAIPFDDRILLVMNRPRIHVILQLLQLWRSSYCHLASELDTVTVLIPGICNYFRPKRSNKSATTKTFKANSFASFNKRDTCLSVLPCFGHELRTILCTDIKMNDRYVPDAPIAATPWLGYGTRLL